MTTTYTDDRFDYLKITHEGGATFNIWCKGELDHYHSEDGWTNTDCFTHYSRHAAGGENCVSGTEAAEIVAEHFDEMEQEELENQ